MPRRKKRIKRVPWTTAEIRTLEEHASEGMVEVKRLLPNRSESSIRTTASRYDISLARRWFCPMCNRTVYEPLKPSTGWCRECSKKHTLERNQMEARAIRMLSLGHSPSADAVAELDKQINTAHQENGRIRKNMQQRRNTGDDLQKREGG